METTLLRVQNPRALLIPQLNAFVLKALSTSPLIEDASAALMEIADYIPHAHAGLYVVREGSEYTAFALLEYTGSALAPGCTVLHFYNGGSPEARKVLIDAVITFARSHGQTKIWGFDINQRPKGFVKLFRAAGPAKPLGQLYEFDMTEGEV